MQPDRLTVQCAPAQVRLAWLALAVLAWGLQAVVTQAVLLREAVVLMSGNELAWGIVLFAWLLGVAVGAAVGGCVAKHRQHLDCWLSFVLLLLGVSGIVDLWLFRTARAWLGLQPGELLPLAQTAGAALLLITPTSGLIGLAFPLACSLRRERGGASMLSLGAVYTLESAGSLVGGAAFSFWAVEHLAPVQTLLASMALTSLACGGLLWSGRRTGQTAHRRWHAARAGPLLLAGLVAGAAIWVGPALNRWLIEQRWRTIAPGYELVAQTESKHQNLALGWRAGQYSLYCDGQVAADFPDPYTFVPLAHFWLCQHPDPRCVLVIGGGAEGLLAEILTHPVERVDYVEPDPRLTELMGPFLSAADRRALQDPRLRVHHTDARYFIKTQRHQFDLVLARLPEPTSAHRARFYTAEFFAELRAAMTERAVLCLTAAAAPAELSAPARQYLATLRATLAGSFAQVIVGWGDPAHLLVATVPELLTIDAAELTRRYEQRVVQTCLFDPAWFAGATDWLDADKVARRQTELDSLPRPPVATDLRPVIYMQRLELWEHMTTRRGPTGQAGAGIVAWLRARQAGEVATLLAGLIVLTLLAGRFGRDKRADWASGAVAVSVGSTGFATMALSIVWLFAFQNLYGYIYQRIGWIIALFMAGLVVGAWATDRRTDPARAGGKSFKTSRRLLIVLDVLLAVLSWSAPPVLTLLYHLPTGPHTFRLVEVCVSLMVVLTGLLGGAAFPPAGRVQAALRAATGQAAARIVAADHLGACLGALLTGLLLVPVLGIVAAVGLLATLKAVSATVVIFLVPSAPTADAQPTPHGMNAPLMR